ncbi:hypothetical protein SeMB42_g03556 [Synchytrium endobioticum]|uniref:Uncharacterized protein n=1 Tax=Synchytrium endobioticum TaxID=286115 RepID=A0A507D5I7_9FUNG|nr:hypothetical protein SeMB42_g03556 [Synchytrium endobioticum]
MGVAQDTCIPSCLDGDKRALPPSTSHSRSNIGGMDDTRRKQGRVAAAPSSNMINPRVSMPSEGKSADKAALYGVLNENLGKFRLKLNWKAYAAIDYTSIHGAQEDERLALQRKQYKK